MITCMIRTFPVDTPKDPAENKSKAAMANYSLQNKLSHSILKSKTWNIILTSTLRFTIIRKKACVSVPSVLFFNFSFTVIADTVCCTNTACIVAVADFTTSLKQILDLIIISCFAFFMRNRFLQTEFTDSYLIQYLFIYFVFSHEIGL